MTDAITIARIETLYRTRGQSRYGEGVTQIDHALQCAALAEASGASTSLIVAALLHDIGHLLEGEDGVTPAATDLRHEVLGAAILKPLFGAAVSAPVALHVAAKRYLCAVDPDYRATLSAASQASLVLQGGVFDAPATARFERGPHWRAAVALRRFDDTGKADLPATRRFADYRAMMDDLAQRHGRSSAN